MNENQNNEDVKIVYAYIGYSDGTGEKGSWREQFYPEIPEHVLMYFAGIHLTLGLPESIIGSDDRIRIHNQYYGKKMTRRHVVEFVDRLSDAAEREVILHRLEGISEDISFMLVVEDENAEADESSEAYRERQYGQKAIADCIQFSHPVPMCDKRFPVQEPDVELGYVRGVFTGHDTPFFAKLWQSRQSGLKYVTIVYCYDLIGETGDQAYQTDDETVTVLRKSGLAVVKPIKDSYEISKTVLYLGSHGVFRYSPGHTVLQYSCYLCKDREGNELLAYTTAVTEPYEDEPLKTVCNLEFTTSDEYDTRAIFLLNEKVGKLRGQAGFQERFQIVKEAIDQWDKIGLYLSNDYDGESEEIAAIITEDSCVEEIAEAISYVFSLMFWARGNAPEHCIWPAKLIREEFDRKYFGMADHSGRQKICDDKVRRFILSGDRIYYSNKNDGESIYRIHLDGTGRQKLNDEHSWYLSLQDDWLNYLSPKDGYRIYRLRTDGSERQQINDDDSEYLQVVNPWIYYHTYDADNHYRDEGIYRVRTDGSQKQRVCTPGDTFYKVDGEWLYYRSSESRNESVRGLYKVRVDGTEKSRISNQNPYLLEVHDGWLYYENNDDKKKLYRMNTCGGAEQKLADFMVKSLTFINGWLYLLKIVKVENQWPKRTEIYRMRPDGSDLRLLIDVNCENYTIDAVDDRIYFSNGDDGYSMYRMRMDGTEVKKLNDDISSHIRIDGDWIYYLKGKEGYSKIYRIPLEGIRFDDAQGGD